MKIRLTLYLIFLLSFIFIDFSMGQTSPQNTISSFFNAPKGYTRISVTKNSFEAWIRNLPLKPPQSPVLDFRGKIFKSKDDTTVAAVVDWKISNRRLDQCMDILIRFYAEYLWENDLHDKLILPLPGGQFIKWKDWENGFRPKFKGINFDLIKSEKYNPTKDNYDRFLNLVFAETHTQQFYYAYPAIDKKNVQGGDFIVKKGIKGHAVMIVDIAQNSDGNMIALIGQGDTPACEFYLLNYKKDNPWIPLDFQIEHIPLPIKKKMTWDGLRRFQ
jgi:hypothetical protein